MGVITLAFVSSCNKDEEKNEVVNTTLETRSTNLITVLENRNRFAKAFSKAIQNPDFYDFIINECLNSPLKDAEILYSKIYNKSISRLGLSFANYLAHIESTTIGGVSNSSQFYNTTCITYDPLLGIVVMPGRFNDYSSIGTITNSNKVYIDKMFEEFSSSEHITYAYNGTTSSHLYDQEPSDPYFAIKQNEEYIAYDLTTEEVKYLEPATLTTCGDYIRYNDVKSIEARIVTLGNIAIADKDYNSGTGGGTAQPRSCTELCDRDCLDGKDAITRIKFNHDYEGWPRGGPEFIMQYALAFSNSQATTPAGFVLEKSSRIGYNLEGDENKWYYKNRKETLLKDIQLLTWNKTNHSSDMQELWTEDDGKFKTYNFGFTFNFTPPSSSGGVGFSIPLSASFSAGDDEIGTVLVQYCDNWSDSWGYQYVVSGPSGDLFFAQLDRDY
jgi:hypothetical protein